ncbi:MAG: M48 family metallopeptidase [Lachnospiraceae bacterium]|nr:M48 family metallopeptidase [Lachnospiraceae bacterium]
MDGNFIPQNNDQNRMPQGQVNPGNPGQPSGPMGNAQAGGAYGQGGPTGNAQTGGAYGQGGPTGNAQAGGAYGQGGMNGAGGFNPGPDPRQVQAEIKKTRHSWEVPMYIISILAGVLGVGLALLQFLLDGDMMSGITEAIDSGSLDVPGPLLFVLLTFGMSILAIVSGITMIILTLLYIIIILYQLYADQMCYSVKVSEKNYPEIYKKVQEFSMLLGMKRPPEVYVQQMNGQLNAYTSWVFGKPYIQLNAEIVDVAYLEHKDPESVYFIMAHEFGHAYLHHVQLKYIFWSFFANFLPVIGPFVIMPLLSRAREYSADRVAQALMPAYKGEEAMLLLIGGRHTYKYLDVNDYLQRINSDHNGMEHCARWFMNFLSSHPIMPFRIVALMDPRKKSGRMI